MIGSNFLSTEDRRELLACVKRQREDHGVARRANALLLLDDGKSCFEGAQVLYLDDGAGLAQAVSGARLGRGCL